jgi:serine protease Do
MRFTRFLRRSIVIACLICGGVFVRLPEAHGQNEAESLSASFRKAAKRVLPAVVTVRVELPAVDMFGGPRLVPPIPPVNPGGSGVVIDAAKGFVLTNDHVVAGGPRVVVVLPDGQSRVAKSVKRDPKSDLALLTIDPAGLKAAEWGDSDALEPGDWVLAVGQPFGLSGTVTAGIVSGKARGIGLALYEDLVQTDAAIGPGNSGGPLVNLKGEIVGINTAIKTLGGGHEGISFALPSSRAKRVAADLAEFGQVRRAYLGLGIRPADGETLTPLGGQPAVLIYSVARRGPGADADLRAGDLIVKLRGRPISGIGQLQAAIEVAPIGEPLELSIVREGKERTVSIRPVPQPESLGAVEPGGRPAVEPAPPVPTTGSQPTARGVLEARAPTRFPELGLRLAEVTPDLLKKYDFEPDLKGLMVRGVEPEGRADRGGLEIGMIITDVAMVRVETLADFRAALAKRPEGQDLVIRVRKGPKAEFRVILDRLPENDHR